jgi:hypothetical protein
MSGVNCLAAAIALGWTSQAKMHAVQGNRLPCADLDYVPSKERMPGILVILTSFPGARFWTACQLSEQTNHRRGLRRSDGVPGSSAKIGNNAYLHQDIAFNGAFTPGIAKQQQSRVNRYARTGRLCAWAHKRLFVLLVILWLRTPSGALGNGGSDFRGPHITCDEGTGPS